MDKLKIHFPKLKVSLFLFRIFEPMTSKLIFFIILFISSLAINKPVKGQLNCDNDTTGLISLVDLQTGFYLGEFQGGLYPGGSNQMPLSHLNKGIKVSKAIKPLDSLGNVDFVNGKVYLACFGSSTSAQPFKKYQTLLETTEGLNNCFETILCHYGGGLENMTMENTEYWEGIENEKLIPEGVTPEQIQVGWLMNASREDSIYDMPLQADSVKAKYIRTFQALYANYTNLKILYLSPPYYGGYADPTDEFFEVNQEPCSYHTGFAGKWAIQDQIFGDPSLKFKGAGKLAPFLSWGPHIWADGLRANSYDGLSWNCEDYRVDGAGIHLNDGGKEILGDIIYDFFLNDTIASFWYKDAPKWASCLPRESMVESTDDIEFKIYPNPNSGSFYISCKELTNVYCSIHIINNIGNTVFEDHVLNVNGIVAVYEPKLVPGIYLIQITANGKTSGQKFIVN